MPRTKKPSKVNGGLLLQIIRKVCVNEQYEIIDKGKSKVMSKSEYHNLLVSYSDLIAAQMPDLFSIISVYQTMMDIADKGLVHCHKVFEMLFSEYEIKGQPTSQNEVLYVQEIHVSDSDYLFLEYYQDKVLLFVYQNHELKGGVEAKDNFNLVSYACALMDKISTPVQQGEQV